MLRQNINIFLLSLAVLLLFILLRNSNIFDVSSIVRDLLVPQRAVNQLLGKPADIDEAYKDLLAENNQLKTLAEENNQLRQILNFKNNSQSQLVVANVISKDPSNNNVLIIDQGSNQGIAVGQAAIVNNGIIVGKIFEVSENSASVRLLTDSNSKLAVRVGNQHEVSGLLTGSLGLSMDLSFVPQEQDIQSSDLVVTAALDIKVPPGLVVGTVENIQFSEEEIFKKASVSPLVDYETIGLVAVVTGI